MRAPLLALAIVLFVPSAALAKAERTVAQPFERVWPTAIRHIRIDEGHTIVDKDADAGYVVFEVKDDGKTFKGALELVRVKAARPAVRLVLQIEGRPVYMESGMLDRLLQKLAGETRSEDDSDADADEPPAPPKDE